MNQLFNFSLLFIDGILNLIQNSWLFDFVGLAMLSCVVIIIKEIIGRR
jgi:hypothetical protein